MSTSIKTLISILGVAFLLSSPFASAADAPKGDDAVKACKAKCKADDKACMKKCEPKEEKKK